ncbi:MAG: hypothetical protein HOV79_16855 [Hamadaea sp.]|nr:hypothetical protein [Hamadaea sp.]
MTAMLRRTLADVADQAPGVRVPPNLWHRGRRLRRRRRTTALLACLLLIAAVVWSPLQGVGEPQFAGKDNPWLPSEVDEPYLWQRTLDEDPNGPAKVVFSTQRSLTFETAVVVIGRDDSYRVLYLNPGEEAGSLSPDGRYLLGSTLLDLATGERRSLGMSLSPMWAPVWDPSSRMAAAVVDRDDAVISYGPNGEQLNDPSHPDGIVLVSAADGTVRTLHDTDVYDFRAAFSPNGSLLAVTVGKTANQQELLVLDVKTGMTVQRLPLGAWRRLAGSAAWTPDGSQLILAYGESCTWSSTCNPDDGQRYHLQYVDVWTGKATHETARGRRGWPELIAWRDGAPVLTVTTHDDVCTVQQIRADGEAVVLPLRVRGYRCGTYPRDALELWALDGPGLSPSVWDAQWWAYACTLVTALVVAALVTFAVRLRRGRRRR